jgi:hypothetical protein
VVEKATHIVGFSARLRGSGRPAPCRSGLAGRLARLGSGFRSSGDAAADPSVRGAIAFACGQARRGRSLRPLVVPRAREGAPASSEDQAATGPTRTARATGGAL